MQTFTIMKSDMFTVAEKERETLVYKNVIYGCAHGTQRKQQSQGSRPQQRTRKLDCPVSFTVEGRKRSGLLTITEEPTQQHSHALGQELWQHEPEKRKLSADDVHVVMVSKHVSVAQITKVIFSAVSKISDSLSSPDQKERKELYLLATITKLRFEFPNFGMS